MTTANHKKKGDFLGYDVYHRCIFFKDEIESNNNSRMINLMIILQISQAREKKGYNCKKTNYNIKMISKKRLEKSNKGLVAKINQMQVYQSDKKED